MTTNTKARAVIFPDTLWGGIVEWLAHQNITLGEVQVESGMPTYVTRRGQLTTGPVAALGLSEREMQVLLGMSNGKSNGAIGRELYISEDTVKTHARRLFRKLQVADRAHAVAVGYQRGLLPLTS